ncbi:MAG: acyl-CoA dehydrogenase [Deltaproteobacteria bacterium]|nr:acyl-CoA dehydrogenase [Deltaproteobacteria bacterium]
MHFDLTDEQRALRDMVRDFARNELKPIAAEIDEHHKFPTDIVKKMGELGLMGVAFPDEYGGAGMDYVSYSIAIEELSWACASTGVICSAHSSLATDPIYKWGNEEQKKKYIPKMASGEWIGCFALSEPQAGSDASQQATVAVQKGDKWILNGTKNFITNGREAEIAIVFAQTDKEKRHKGITAFIVEKNNFPGISVGKVEDKLGIRGSSTTQLILEDCEIPDANRLGDVGVGFRVAMSTLDGGRIGIASQALGIAARALDESVAYSKERHAFGKPIADLQAIQWKIADMATEIDAARLLTWRAAWMKDGKMNFSRQAAMAKLFASEAAMRATTQGIQIHGGYGYCRDYPMERLFRDAKITEIYEGTSEIQRLVIASSVIRE